MHAQSRCPLDAKSPPGVSLVSRIWHSAAWESIRELVTPRPRGATGRQQSRDRVLTMPACRPQGFDSVAKRLLTEWHAQADNNPTRAAGSPSIHRCVTVPISPPCPPGFVAGHQHQHHPHRWNKTFTQGFYSFFASLTQCTQSLNALFMGYFSWPFFATKAASVPFWVRCLIWNQFRQTKHHFSVRKSGSAVAPGLCGATENEPPASGAGGGYMIKQGKIIWFFFFK